MSLINKENLLAAQCMYKARLQFLQEEVQLVTQRGLALGEAHEAETMAALDAIEQELKGVDECLGVLKHLLRS